MRQQRGGFVLGLVVGLLVGLALALGVALWVTKVPVPFVNKVPQRTAEQDAAEAERNRHWDPNAPLASRAPASAPAATAPSVAPPASAAKPARDPAAILAGKAPVTSSAAVPDPFTYFVQAGAYSRTEDAEQQKARLAMLGLDAKVTEREQSGRTMYRVRVGPYERKEDAESAKDKLGAAGVDASLVRVQRSP